MDGLLFFWVAALFVVAELWLRRRVGGVLSMRFVSWMLLRDRRWRTPKNTAVITRIAAITRAVIAANRGSMGVAYLCACP